MESMKSWDKWNKPQLDLQRKVILCKQWNSKGVINELLPNNQTIYWNKYWINEGDTTETTQKLVKYDILLEWRHITCFFCRKITILTSWQKNANSALIEPLD